MMPKTHDDDVTSDGWGGPSDVINNGGVWYMTSHLRVRCEGVEHESARTLLSPWDNEVGGTPPLGCRNVLVIFPDQVREFPLVSV